MVVEGGEKRNPKTAIRHGIEQTMARGGKEEIQPHRERVHSRHSVPKSERNDDERQQGSESERMREASVSPKVSIPDTEAESDYIEVWDYGKRCSNHPNTFGNLWFVEKGSNTKGCHHVRGQ